MGITKTDGYTKQQKQRAVMLKAIAHPARLAIIEYLANANQCIGNEIVDALPLSQPTISQHLHELKSAGWIRGEIEGKCVRYCLQPQALALFQQYFSALHEKAECFDCS